MFIFTQIHLRKEKSDGVSCDEHWKDSREWRKRSCNLKRKNIEPIYLGESQSTSNWSLACQSFCTLHHQLPNPTGNMTDIIEVWLNLKNRAVKSIWSAEILEFTIEETTFRLRRNMLHRLQASLKLYLCLLHEPRSTLWPSHREKSSILALDITEHLGHHIFIMTCLEDIMLEFRPIWSVKNEP